MTEVEPRKAYKAIRLFINGRCWLERRAKLAVHLDGRHVIDALNELVVSSGSPAKMLDLRLGVDSRRARQNSEEMESSYQLLQAQLHTRSQPADR